MPVSETQNWAKLIPVGDIQVLICKRSTPCDDHQVPDELRKTGRIIYLVDIEFHLNDDEHPFTMWFESKEERDNLFDYVQPSDMKTLIENELGCNLPI